MTITLRVQDDGSVVLDRATGKVEKFAVASTRAGTAARGAASSHVVYWSETDKVKDAIDRVNAAEAARAASMQRTNSLFGFFKHSTTDASSATSDFGKVLQANVGQLSAYASAAAAAGAALGLYLVKRGLEQNSIMQQSRLGMAALVSSLGEITDQNDKVLQGQDRWNASLEISEKLQARLKIAALATVANYKDLVQVMQEGLGPMLQAQISDPAKIVAFVQAIAQTGGALGIPGDRLGQEIRALLQGEKGPDNQLANALLGDTTKQRFDQLKQKGEIFDFLMKKMSSFQKAGEEASTTLAGSLSNLQDAIDQALGEGTSGEVSSVTRAILALTDQIVSFDDAGKAVFNPDFIKGVNELAHAFVFLAEAAVMIAEDIPDTVEALKNLSGKSLLRAAWQSATGQYATVVDIDEIIDKVKRESVGPGKEVLDLTARNRGNVFLDDKRKNRTFPEFATTMDRGSVEQELGYFLKKNVDTGDSAASWAKSQRFHDILAAYVGDGKLTIQEMREAERKFEEEAAAIANGTGPKLKGKPIKPQPTEEQQRSIDALRLSWKRDVSTFHRDADAAGDPVAMELAKIADVRQQKLDELAKQKTALGKFMSADEFTKRKADIESVWGKEGEASAIARDNPQKTKQTKIDTQRAIEDARLDVIRDSIERELQMTLAKDQREFDDAKKGLDASSKEYQALADKRAALDQVAAGRAQQARDDKVKDVGTDVQRTVEDARLDVIHDSIERELQMTLAKNRREFEDSTKWLSASGLEYTALTVKKNALDQLALGHANKARDEDLKATTAWAKKTAEMIADSYEKVPQLVRDAAIASRQALTGETETFFTDLMSHNQDLAKELGDLSQTLGKSWAHIFAQILTNGGSVTGQLKTMWAGLNKAGGNPMTDSGSLLDAGVQGAGLGSFIGGIFGGPHNQGALGGTIGGGIGAIIGTLAYGNTAAGAAIGAAIGTALGSLIQKGADSIKVAMTGITIGSLRGKFNQVDLPNESTDIFADGGKIDVTEKGISPQAREDLLVQLRRKTKEALKSWQDILDLLPQDLKDQLASMPPPNIYLSGGVEEGDIRDENALTSLQDFLGNKMPKAVYGAYHDSIAKAMSLMGVQYGRAQEMFAEWGTLTGQELHDAVQRFFKAVLEANDWKGKIGGSRVDDANKVLDQTEAGKLRDINAQIGLGVASMSKLTDVDDIIAAQERLNELSRQYYDESLAATEQLIAEQKQLHDQNQSLQEQVQLAGMGDQQKMDYFYGQLTNLRENLKRATDPKDIAAIEQKMNAYVQSALGLAPDNAENRDKLLGILKDIEEVRDSRIAVAQQEIVDQNQKAATMLQQAATALLGAADALKPPSTSPGTGGGDGGDKLPPGPVDPEPLPPLYATADVNAFGSALRVATDDLRHLHDWASVAGGQQEVAYAPQTSPSRTSGGTDAESWQTAARAIRDALDGFEIGGSMQVAIDVNADGLVDAAARQAVQTVKIQFQRNPDSFRSRTGARR